LSAGLEDVTVLGQGRGQPGCQQVDVVPLAAHGLGGGEVALADEHNTEDQVELDRDPDGDQPLDVLSSSAPGSAQRKREWASGDALHYSYIYVDYIVTSNIVTSTS
jgi:hypothetical protein